MNSCIRKIEVLLQCRGDAELDVNDAKIEKLYEE
jgi:hypothetical protein